MKTYEERKQITINLLNKGQIDLSTFGQLAVNQFNDEIIERAVERKWIDKEVAELIK